MESTISKSATEDRARVIAIKAIRDAAMTCDLSKLDEDERIATLRMIHKIAEEMRDGLPWYLK